VPDEAAIRAACTLLASLPDSDSLTERDVQSFLATAVRLYADHAAKQDAPAVAFPPDSAVTATEAMIATTAILKAVNLQIFELGMWQAWTGR
jgi:hypothetical protein